ncbi:MAG: hypothetical protein R3Y58_01830 [Eubacteriales bacterium]
MTFTYEISKLAETPLFQVRFRLGDTEEDTARFDDGEIAYMLELHNNNIVATCIGCVTALLPKLTTSTEFTVGPYSEKEGANAFDYWSLYLASLQKEVIAGGAPVMAATPKKSIFHYGMLGVGDHENY